VHSTITIEHDPPGSVRKWKRGDQKYTALYDHRGRLHRLLNSTTHEEVPAESQTFKRLADGNRGKRFKEVYLAPDYNVVLVHKKTAGGYAGVRTWSSYPSKVEFERWYVKSGRQEYDIVAQNVTEAEALRLCERTPLRNLVRAAVEDATDPEGIVHPEIARMKMMTVMVARRGQLAPIY